ncbi:hypothetical protein GCM10027521_31000 [Amycolatopsis cihanbeyliensis]
MDRARRDADGAGVMTPALSSAEVVSQLGFVLAIDNCARGCRHCPAYGSAARVERASLRTLSRRLHSVAAARRRLGLSARPERTVHCWRISDPLDWVSRTRRDGTATAADLALLWRERLGGQGLYVVTNGSEGRRTARQALTVLAAMPVLVSQLKITITPADATWGTEDYVAALAADVRIAKPLWELPADRGETRADARRLRLNVKTTVAQEAEAREVTEAILRGAGLSRKSTGDVIDDPRFVAFKPIYDLGAADGAASPVPGALDLAEVGTGRRYKPTPRDRSRTQYGIRPDGRLFAVDMYAFTETDLSDHETGRALYWDDRVGEVAVSDV